MALTLGQLSLRLLKTPAGRAVDRVLLVGLINDVYEIIGRAHPWMRLQDNDAQIQTVAIYSNGSITVFRNLELILLTDGTFTSAMDGRRMRVEAGQEYYRFIFDTDNSGYVDRPYEGDSNLAASYQLIKAIYDLPAGCEVIESIKTFYDDEPLARVTQEVLDREDTSRQQTGRPQAFAPFEDSNGLQRIELWPAPEDAEGLVLRYTAKFTRLTTQSSSFLDWVPEGLLFAGCMAMLEGRAVETDPHFSSQLQQLIRQDTRRMPPTQLRMSRQFTDHRRARAFGYSHTEERKRQM